MSGAAADQVTGSPFERLLEAWSAVGESDPDVAALLLKEADRERRTLRLIASENYVSAAVLAAASSTLTNKYANGYPGDRRYPGCEWADEIESLAVSRAKEVFGAEHVNVQPHSGSQANLAAYMAVASPGDTLLALDPSHGGHFTHGAPDNFSARFFHFEHFGVAESSGLIDIKALERRAKEVRPVAIVVGPTSYPRAIDADALAVVAREVEAFLILDIAHTSGLIAGRAFPDPVGHADILTFTTHKTLRGPRGGAIICRQDLAERVDRAVFPAVQGGPNLPAVAGKAVAFREAATREFSAYVQRAIELGRTLAATFTAEGLRVSTGGTDSHVVLVDLTHLDIDGQEAEAALENCGVLANRSHVPHTPGDQGIRFGTAAVATLGATTNDMERLGAAIVKLLRNTHSSDTQYELTSLVSRLCERLVPYPQGTTDGLTAGGS